MNSTAGWAPLAAVPDVAYVQVFHNNSGGGRELPGYRAGHSVTEVFSYLTAVRGHSGDLDFVEEALGLLSFSAAPDYGVSDLRSAEYVGRGNRPLACGDVVAVDGWFYSFEPHGWRSLSEVPTVRQRAAPGTSRLY